MTAIAAVTINDGQATPVAHTFSPVNIDQAGVAKWADRSSGIALGFPALSFSQKTPNPKGARNYKMSIKVVLPVLEVTSPSTSTGIQPAPTKAYDLIATVDFTLPERSTLAQRNDLLAYVKNFLANAAVVTPAVQNFESVY
uniref:Coat protein n=1 Tax=Leviviridae sp. TaxID=2027243 RepID=A0A514D2Q1_9VIRU|nr:MAG: hypothetical protein H2RhizoLitter493524_000002 [Leviviridae sp.]